jgi:hypothetical protein
MGNALIHAFIRNNPASFLHQIEVEHGIIKALWYSSLNYKVTIILRKEKRKQKLSMAKINCNLIIEKYGEDRQSLTKDKEDKTS